MWLGLDKYSDSKVSHKQIESKKILGHLKSRLRTGHHDTDSMDDTAIEKSLLKVEFGAGDVALVVKNPHFKLQYCLLLPSPTKKNLLKKKKWML
jgi:hypothetical protein